jgi:hypothetical protein
VLHDDEHRPSILVIATWYDGEQFFARVTRTDDREESGKSSVVMADKRLVLDEVAAWLAEREPGVNGRTR